MKKLWLTVRLICVVFVFCSAMAIVSPAQFLITLHNFDGTDGSMPYAGLVQAADGNFYGTTAFGPANSGYSGYGTVFQMAPDGTFTMLWEFTGNGGASPYGALLQASDGNFYGTTLEGGNQSCDQGCGTVFKITPSGALTTIYRFCAQSGCADGSAPWSTLIQATDGNFYGTTSSGGINDYGTVFRITPSGTLTTLRSFQLSDGVYPEAGLVQASDGNFYGTAYDGGAGCVNCGTVFKITPSGNLTVLYNFQSTDGFRPEAALVQASDGNFYGTTSEGGIGNCVNGCGTVFEITPDGTLTFLHRFAGPDGGDPIASLIQASDGNFYGTTYVRGAYNYGEVFEMTPNGNLTVLHSFIDSPSEGFYPTAGLVQGRDELVPVAPTPFYIAPGFGTALFYKQQNDLHLTTQAQGFLQLIAGVFGVLAAVGYGILVPAPQPAHPAGRMYGRRHSGQPRLPLLLVGRARPGDRRIERLRLHLGRTRANGLGRALHTRRERGVGIFPDGQRPQSGPVRNRLVRLEICSTSIIFLLISLVIANSATTLIAVPLVFLLPRLIVLRKDAEIYEPAPAPKAMME